MPNEPLLNEIHRALGRIEGNQDRFLDMFKSHVAEDREAWEKVDKLTNKQSYVSGKLSVYASVLGLLGGAVAAFFGKHF